MKRFWRRRQFLAMGGAFAAIRSLPSFATTDANPRYVAASPTILDRMAFTPATKYRPYISRTTRQPDATTWIQVDLGELRNLDSIRLYPAFHLGPEDRIGFGFPIRFKIDLSDDPSFGTRVCIVDHTTFDCPDPKDAITEYHVGEFRKRFVRLSALKLRP